MSQSMRIHILTEKPRHSLLPIAADWYPIYLNQQHLQANGLTFKVFTEINDELTDCNTLCLSSRYFAIHNQTDQIKNDTLQLLARLKQKVSTLIWFDFRDSTGCTSFEVLPYVDKYLKKQLLIDYSPYRQQLYGNRIYTNYIHQRFGITDDYQETQTLLPQDQEHKLGISWNPGLLDFRGGTNPQLGLNRLSDSLAANLKTTPKAAWHDPQANRPHNMLATFNTNYARRTVAWQRRHAPSILKQINDDKIVSNKIPLKAEIKARFRSKLVLSLFGWGELCSRDYQTFIAGAALIAPDTSHLKTWPVTHIPNKTYLPIKWDLSDLSDKYHQIIGNNDLRLQLATTGQQKYHHLWSSTGRQQFADHFRSLVRQEQRMPVDLPVSPTS